MAEPLNAMQLRWLADDLRTRYPDERGQIVVSAEQLEALADELEPLTPGTMISEKGHAGNTEWLLRRGIVTSVYPASTGLVDVWFEGAAVVTSVSRDDLERLP